MVNKVTIEQALGISETHVVIEPQLNKPVHYNCVEPLLELQQNAQRNGFDLQLASGFRSFDRQLLIWNNKANRLTNILDNDDNVIDTSECSDIELIEKICHWSAIPGASRHHWGTDVDIYDAAALGDSQLQLTKHEAQTLFIDFYDWLNEVLMTDTFNDFKRPYSEYKGGIGVEPWHLSYAPVAEQYEEVLNCRQLKQQLIGSDIAIKQAIIDNIGNLYQRYVAPHFLKPTIF